MQGRGAPGASTRLGAKSRPSPSSAPLWRRVHAQDASLYGVLPSVRDAVQLLGAGRALRVRQVDAAARPASARSAPAAAGPQLDPETGLALPGVDLVDDAGSTDSDGGGWDGGGAWLSAAEAAAARQVATVADAERVALFHAECDAAAVVGRERRAGAQPGSQWGGGAAADDAGAEPAVAARGGGAWRVTNDTAAVAASRKRRREALEAPRTPAGAVGGSGSGRGGAGSSSRTGGGGGGAAGRYHSDAVTAGAWKGRDFAQRNTAAPPGIARRGTMSAELREALGIAADAPDVRVGGALVPRGAPFLPRLQFRGEMPGWAAQQLTAIAAGRLDALVTAEKQLVDASLDLFTGDSAADGSE